MNMNPADFDLSDDTVKWIRDEFERWDPGNCGKIKTSDLGEWLRHVGFLVTDDEEEFLMNCFDENSDGFIEMDEMLANIRIVQAHSVKGDEIRKAFNIFDRDGDGTIRMMELKSILCLNDFMKPDEAGQLITRLVEKFDRNKDGKFSYSEFVEIFCAGCLPGAEIL